jgi:hypothetical protein
MLCRILAAQTQPEMHHVKTNFSSTVFHALRSQIQILSVLLGCAFSLQDEIRPSRQLEKLHSKTGYG